MSFDFDATGLRLACRVIVVGGTNGKGSTCAFLEAMASQAGYRTAVYSSPHLVHFEERLRLQGQDSEASDWVAAFEAVGRATEKAGASLTYFEWVTLAAFDMVRRQPLDMA
ncbi:MAG TPA: bifunctional folylpolyglutamate synthase/dihydrofolate synthase, partial [Burkholderiaceae bacterium]|nr:bifunctional folylpolyglutamate synthase/dihydrofolate synthase [Burkholderiaceae bacterium]